MLRSEAVVDGDNDSTEFPGKSACRIVDRQRIDLPQDEATTVVEDDDGHADDVFGTGGWYVEAEPQVARRVNGGIGGGNAIGTVAGIGRGRDFEVNEVEEAAVDGHVGAERGVDDPGRYFENELQLPWQVGFATCAFSETFSTARHLSHTETQSNFGLVSGMYSNAIIAMGTSNKKN